jgi:hypothetical protein
LLVHYWQNRCILVLPYMASLVAKKKGNHLYYYVVESARVAGRPRIVHQAYLGTADKVAALVKDRTSPLPLSAASRDLGLPGAFGSPRSKPDWRIEQSFRYNNRRELDDFDRFKLAASQMIGKRLTWKEVTGKNHDPATSLPF